MSYVWGPLLAISPLALIFLVRKPLIEWIAKRHSTQSVTIAFTACVVILAIQSMYGLWSNRQDQHQRDLINGSLAGVSALSDPTQKRVRDYAQATSTMGTLAEAQSRGADAARSWTERKAALARESADIDSVLAGMKRTLNDAQQSSDALRSRADGRNFWMLLISGLLSPVIMILGFAMLAMRKPR